MCIISSDLQTVNAPRGQQIDILDVLCVVARDRDVEARVAAARAAANVEVDACVYE